jgi:hypothetical protein
MPRTCPFRRKLYWRYQSCNFTAGTILWGLLEWDWGYAGWHVWLTPWLRVGCDVWPIGQPWPRRMTIHWGRE